MGDRGEHMQQMTTGRTRTRVAVFRTEPIWYALYPVNQQGVPHKHLIVEMLFGNIQSQLMYPCFVGTYTHSLFSCLDGTSKEGI